MTLILDKITGASTFHRVRLLGRFGLEQADHFLWPVAPAPFKLEIMMGENMSDKEEIVKLRMDVKRILKRLEAIEKKLEKIPEHDIHLKSGIRLKDFNAACEAVQNRIKKLKVG